MIIAAEHFIQADEKGEETSRPVGCRDRGLEGGAAGSGKRWRTVSL